MKNKTIKRLILPLLWLLLILFLSGQDGETSGVLSGNIASFLKNILSLSSTEAEINVFLRKAAHVFVFLVEGILVIWALSDIKYRLPVSLVTCILFAILDECRKLFVPGRHCDFGEMGLNTIAASFAVCFYALICYLVRKDKN